jgi:hypothetical protein
LNPGAELPAPIPVTVAAAPAPGPPPANVSEAAPPAQPVTDGALATGRKQAASWAEAGLYPFQHAGSWFLDRPGGPLRWEPASQQWQQADRAAIPFFMRRPAFASLRTPSLWLFGLMGLFGLLCLLGIVADGFQAAEYHRSATGTFISSADLRGTRDFYAVVKTLQAFAFLGCTGVFIWWLRRATCNVPSLGAANPEFSPGWSVGWWFIPIANWFQPLRVVNQAWRASAPGLPAEESAAWRDARVSPLVLVWWLSYVIGNSAWGSAVNSLSNSSKLSDKAISDLSYFILVMDVGMAAVTVLAITVVAKLTARQERANQRLVEAAR